MTSQSLSDLKTNWLHRCYQGGFYTHIPQRLPNRPQLSLCRKDAYKIPMEFGKLPSVEDVNWRLPAEDPLSAPFLQKLTPTQPLQILFGSPAWGRKEWLGKLYPPKTKSSEFLYHYSRYFTCIELNTTHYRIPSHDQVRKWHELAAPGFLFCPKIFQEISHTHNGLRNRSLLQEWLQFIESMGAFLGPCFLQLPPHFDYSQKAELFGFLKNWPADYDLSLEFRHPSWFQNGRILPALTEYLQSRKIGLVITDVAGRRDVLHTSISAPYSMLRFIGNDLHPSDTQRSLAWSQRFLTWQNMGLQKMFLFIHEPDDISVPEMSEIFLQQLDHAGGWQIRGRTLSSAQPSFTFAAP